jgi:hypothetical protein
MIKKWSAFLKESNDIEPNYMNGGDIGEEYIENGIDNNGNIDIENTIAELKEIAINAVEDLSNINKQNLETCKAIIREIEKLK